MLVLSISVDNPEPTPVGFSTATRPRSFHRSGDRTVAGSTGRERALPGLLSCMHGGGVTLPDDMIPEVDKAQPDQLGDIQDLDVAETGEASADARKERADGDEDVAQKARSSFLHCEIPNGRVNRAAKEKYKGVEIEQWRKSPHPLPDEHAWWTTKRS